MTYLIEVDFVVVWTNWQLLLLLLHTLHFLPYTFLQVIFAHLDCILVEEAVESRTIVAYALAKALNRRFRISLLLSAITFLRLGIVSLFLLLPIVFACDMRILLQVSDQVLELIVGILMGCFKD